MLRTCAESAPVKSSRRAMDWSIRPRSRIWMSLEDLCFGANGVEQNLNGSPSRKKQKQKDPR